uniref:Replication protein A OB domain-containing protein n=1 Tax=Brassica oleracea TaxID=3712 RepID=A0A3P6FPJ7_BRAOL|nr:unnamed protein product [Brassica oleracea]
MSIVGNSTVSESSLENDDNFLSLTPFQSIINGSLDSIFLIGKALFNVIGQAIDVGDIEVVQVLGKEKKKLELTLTDTCDQNIACCLWGRFAEQVLAAYKNAEENNILCLVRYAKINVYKDKFLNYIFRQVQITNAFETSSVVINPDGFDVQDYLRLPTNELALSTVTRDVDDYGETRVMLLDTVAEPILGASAVVFLGGSLDEDDDTLTNAVSSDRSSGPVSLISIESENNTCLSSTPLSKRRVDSDLDDISSTSKKQCFKIIKVEKNNGE